MVKKSRNPVVLMILDGWGMAEPSKGNAITLAKTPVMDKLWDKYPHSLLGASGKDVGLSPKQDGNSEAGHMNIGAGRIVEQDSVIISESINKGTFFKNPAFLETIEHVRRNRSHLHIMGLLTSDQSAHADPDHLLALLTLTRHYDIGKVYLHLFTDGRDSPQYVAIKLLKELEKDLKDNEIIATITGRFYAMDRKKIWERTEKTYNAMVLSEGFEAPSPQRAIIQAYNKKETDEFITPTIVLKDHQKPRRISDGDAIIFFNLRSDRARQLTKAFVQKKFNEINLRAFRRKKVLKDLRFVAMTDFGPDLDGVITAYPSIDIKDTLPMLLVDLKQLYIAESEKYAHVTYFFNGGYPDPVGDEDRLLIKSPDVKSYDLKPEMSAPEITDQILQFLSQDAYDFITLNFANPDMVGHTGNLKAGIKAVEVVDKCVGKILNKVCEKKGLVIITADHGNIEEMINLETGEIDTKHSSNPVPFILVADSKSAYYSKIKNRKRLEKGILGNITSSILEILDIEKSNLMTAKSLI